MSDVDMAINIPFWVWTTGLTVISFSVGWMAHGVWLDFQEWRNGGKEND